MNASFTAKDQNDLTNYFADMLAQALEMGFEAPLHVAAVAVNGTCQVYELTPSDEGGLDTKSLVHFQRGGGFALPINIMVTDSRGEALRVVIDSRGLRMVN